MPLHPREPRLLERPGRALLALEDEPDRVAPLDQLADDRVEEAQVAAEGLHEEEHPQRFPALDGTGLRSRCG